MKARCRDSGSGDVELFPFVRGVKRALTDALAAEGPLGVRELGGLNGDGARWGTGLFRTEEAADTTLAALRGWIVALLLTFAFGLMSGGERDVDGDLNGEAGRGRSKSTRAVIWKVA